MNHIAEAKPPGSDNSSGLHLQKDALSDANWRLDQWQELLEIRMTCARRSNPAVITATSSASITKSASNGKVTKRELQTVLRDLTKSKSMTLGFKLTLNISLLLTTTVAADVQSQLEPFQSGEPSRSLYSSRVSWLLRLYSVLASSRRWRLGGGDGDVFGRALRGGEGTIAWKLSEKLSDGCCVQAGERRSEELQYWQNV
ncbi:MAG: hypothetical protein FRX49_07862 [Trebouxia sp. A1-2]|nr:MAG: hypothetical protein FRX49_07862 [Trebouxia sp. A1-2]